MLKNKNQNTFLDQRKTIQQKTEEKFWRLFRQSLFFQRVFFPRRVSVFWVLSACICLGIFGFGAGQNVFSHPLYRPNISGLQQNQENKFRAFLDINQNIGFRAFSDFSSTVLPTDFSEALPMFSPAVFSSEEEKDFIWKELPARSDNKDQDKNQDSENTSNNTSADSSDTASDTESKQKIRTDSPSEKKPADDLAAVDLTSSDSTTNDLAPDSSATDSSATDSSATDSSAADSISVEASADDHSLSDNSASDRLPSLDLSDAFNDSALPETADPADKIQSSKKTNSDPAKTEFANSEGKDSVNTGLSSAGLSNTDSENVQAPYDPIAENGEYFVDWKKPKVCLVFTGMLDGYLEPCGCAGMDRMKGGLSRRHTFFKELEKAEWPVVAFDGGGIGKGFGVQEELKFDLVSNAFRTMKYDAVGIGKNEILFPANFLLTFTAQPSPFISANVGVYGFSELYTLPYKVVTRNGIRIGMTSVVIPDESVEHRDEYILLEDPVKKLKEILPLLKQEKCDKLVLSVHGNADSVEKLARTFIDFDIIITSDGPPEPPATPKIINGKQILLEVGEKGKYVLVLGMYDDIKEPIKYQRVALDSRFDSSEEIHLLMEGYQDILKSLISDKGYKNGLGLNPAENPQTASLGRYVGTEKCVSCHENDYDNSYQIWKKSGHAVAWKSLTDTASPARDFDPECVSCHVIGWNGPEKFPYQGGFITEKETPDLINVGCESCHGPGEFHVNAELGSDYDLQDKYRELTHLDVETSKKTCFSCHDGDNSPEFEFDSYWAKIKHSVSLDDLSEDDSLSEGNLSENNLSENNLSENGLSENNLFENSSSENSSSRSGLKSSSSPKPSEEEKDLSPKEESDLSLELDLPSFNLMPEPPRRPDSRNSGGISNSNSNIKQNSK